MHQLERHTRRICVKVTWVPTFRIKEAADLLGVSYDTVRRWAEGGRIEPTTDASGRLAVDGVVLARFAQERAESAGRRDDLAAAQSLRNRFSGLVTRVVRDTVMAQVEIQAGPHRFVSLLSREAADELGLAPGVLAVEAAHPGVKVTFSFGASSGLATQITSGAPADVFASASPKNMRQVVAAGDALAPVNFAKNVMEVAVPPANPAHVTSLDDLAKSPVKVALCQPQVPCGAVAAKVFGNARITVTPVTLEPDVKSVLGKVELGDVDAGVVYVTDVNAAGAKVKGVPIPDRVNASTVYPIATISKSGNAATARAFVAYVVSAAGESLLSAAKFEKP